MENALDAIFTARWSWYFSINFSQHTSHALFLYLFLRSTYSAVTQLALTRGGTLSYCLALYLPPTKDADRDWRVILFISSFMMFLPRAKFRILWRHRQLVIIRSAAFNRTGAIMIENSNWVAKASTQSENHFLSSNKDCGRVVPSGLQIFPTRKKKCWTSDRIALFLGLRYLPIFMICLPVYT